MKNSSGLRAVLCILFSFLLARPGLLAAATPTDARFESTAKAFVEDYLKASPEEATQLGDHRFDGELSDYSVAGTEAYVALLKKYLAAVDALPANELTGPNRVDAQILKLNLESQIFSETELRKADWDPLSYNVSLANGLYFLTARDFAPADVRLRSAKQRLAQIPRVVEQAEARLKNPPEIYTQTAIKQINGAIGLARDGLDDLFKQDPAMRAELAPVQEKAVAALTAYKEWLEKDLLPRSHGDFRIGPEKFRRRLRYALASDLTPEEILARAEKELGTVTEQMYATALPLYQKYFPGTDAAALDHRKLIRAVLDRLAQQHPDDATVISYGEGVIKEATEFVRAHDLVTVPDTPVKVIVTPEFRRGRGAAYCDSPGALEPKGETFVAMEPTPAEWPAARRESFYREYNNYMMHDLIVHEAMPGHFLQLAHANQFRAPTLVRAIFESGSFVEGWAVYSERVMAETGFGGPENHMQQLKMRLRVLINAMIDQKIHMAGMTKEQALALMMDQGFQEEGEATGKWQRAQLSYTQLSTYFVGAIEHDDMRTAAEKKMGAAFNLKKYHDLVLSFGSPAVKFVRAEAGL